MRLSSAKRNEQLQSAFAERINFISLVSLFSPIKENTQALEAIAQVMTEKFFSKGDIILREGKSGSEVFFLLDGEVAISKSTPDGERFPVAVLNHTGHAFFGEGALLDEEARSATITAVTDCRCLTLEKRTFEVFGKTHPEWVLPILWKVAQTVMERLRKTNNDLILLYKALVREIGGQID